MNNEIISLETAQKLANREKAIEYIKKMLNKNTSGLAEIYLENVLNILEVNNDRKTIWKDKEGKE